MKGRRSFRKVTGEAVEGVRGGWRRKVTKVSYKVTFRLLRSQGIMQVMCEAREITGELERCKVSCGECCCVTAVPLTSSIMPDETVPVIFGTLSPDCDICTSILIINFK